ncbi:hypothetical protein MNBD_BACTEROID05-522, partial [hydrothermal vent metagenome]
MIKPAILNILLAVFITSTTVFAWMLFAQNTQNIPQPIRQIPPPLAMPYKGNDIIVGGRIATATDTRAIRPSEYTKINSVYAKKDGEIYYAEPLKRHTNKPVYYKVEGADSETFTAEERFYPEWGFAYDKDRVFFDGRMIDIDKQSLEQISGRYFKDKNYVYFIENSSRGSYSILKLPYDVNSF